MPAVETQCPPTATKFHHCRLRCPAIGMQSACSNCLLGIPVVNAMPAVETQCPPAERIARRRNCVSPAADTLPSYEPL